MYDRLIKIQKQTRTVNTVGSPVLTWALLKNKFAHVSYRGGNTSSDDYAARARTDATFTIRHDPAIDYDCRVMYVDQIYRIRHIEIVGRNKQMRLQCIMNEGDE